MLAVMRRGGGGASRWSIAVVLVWAGACSGGDPDEGGPADAGAVDADPTVLLVAGQYATEVSLEESDCTGIMVESMPTTVSHEPGATELTLRHAGQTYTGSVERDGAFATEPHEVGSSAELHTLTIAGRFSTTGFEATVDAAVSRNRTHDCDYVVGWVGTKSGEPNTIPE
jgi:hypothetical protein